MLDIVEASSEDVAAWEEFLESSNNGTLFHSLTFLSYHEPGPVDTRPLIFRDSGRTLAVLPGALRDREGETVFISPWGGSFGGLVVRGGEDLEGIEILVDGWLDWCRERGIRAIEISQPPSFYLDDPNQLTEFVLVTRGFQRVRCDVTDVIPLGGGMEEARSRWRASARKGARKAGECGVVVEESSDLESFYPILEENRERHGATLTHTLPELEKLFELVGHRLKLLLATVGGEPVGGALLFRCNERVALNFYLCHKHEARLSRPADAVMAASIEAAVEWGALHYDLGTSSLGGKPNRGLLQFKGKWGSSPFLREGYRLELNTV